jgi:hypothetical protein
MNHASRERARRVKHVCLTTRRLALALAALSLAGCDRKAENHGALVALRIVQPSLVLAETLHVRAQWTLPEACGMYRAPDLALVPDGLLVGDSGNDRLVLFDRALRPQRTIGRSGGGPGEFRQPFRIRAKGEYIVASELGNPRFSFLRIDGRFSHVVPRDPIEGQFDLATDGTVYMASVLGGHYLLRVGRSGDTASLAAIPDRTRALRRLGGIKPHWRSDLVALTAGDTLHVFDNEIGVLLKYDRSGRLRHAAKLPEELLKRLIERSEAQLRSIAGAGYRVLTSSLARQLSTTSDGALLLNLSMGDIRGLLIDPHTYAARFIRVRGDGGSGEWLPSPRAIAVSDSTLYALDGDGLVSFRLRAAAREDRRAEANRS